jgi:YVTN family beta-propeller protein
MNFRKTALPLAIMVTLAIGCEKGQDKPSGNNYSHGVYIVNEGAFMAGNGSISYFNPSDNQIINGIFEAANNRPLGDVVQSFSVVQDTTGYIIVNGSGKVEIVRLKDFKTSAPPVPVYYPRHFLQVSSGKGYLTAGNYQGTVWVFDLGQRKIVDSIAVGFGPETMLKLDNHAFVANSGGWGLDSTISVIDVTTNQVTSLIHVRQVPLDLALDADNSMWVYCKGYAIYNNQPPYDIISQTAAWLQKINPANGTVTWEQAVGQAGDYTATPPRMAMSKDGNKLFYLRPDGVYALSTSNPAVAATPLIPGSFYGIDVNPEDGNIYVFESAFSGNGTLKVFDSAGNAIGQGTVGIAPNGAVFH